MEENEVAGLPIDGSNPQEEIIEEVEDQGTEESATPEVVDDTPYTTDEIEDLGIENLDPRRVPAELQPLYKSMQRDYVRKTQAIAEKKKELAELNEMMKKSAEPPAPEPPRKPPTTLEEHFDQDPKGTLTYIDQQLRTLAADPINNLQTVTELQIVRSNLVERQREREVEMAKRMASSGTIRAQLKADGLDDEQQVIEYKKIAKEMGFSAHEVDNILFNPDVVGQSSSPLRKTFKALYESRRNTQDLKQKEVKKPTQLEKPGVSAPRQGPVNLAKLREQAIATRDWTKYLEATGNL